MQVRLQQTRLSVINRARKANAVICRILFKTRLQIPWVLYRNCA